jgi:hypothetical protein
MNEPHGPLVHFEIRGDLAIAGYFLMANWPNPNTAPMLVTSNGPMTICFARSAEVLNDLRDTLVRVCAYGGKLGESAVLWLEALKSVEPASQARSAGGPPPELHAG